MYPQSLCIPHTFEAVWFLKMQNLESSSKVAEVKGNWGWIKIFEIFMIYGVWAFKCTSSHVFSTKTHGDQLRLSLMLFPYFSMRFGSSTLTGPIPRIFGCAVVGGKRSTFWNVFAVGHISADFVKSLIMRFFFHVVRPSISDGTHEFFGQLSQ